MATNIKGTRTEKNLLAAFAGESQARNRYILIAGPFGAVAGRVMPAPSAAPSGSLWGASGPPLGTSRCGFRRRPGSFGEGDAFAREWRKRVDSHLLRKPAPA